MQNSNGHLVDFRYASPVQITNASAQFFSYTRELKIERIWKKQTANKLVFSQKLAVARYQVCEETMNRIQFHRTIQQQQLIFKSCSLNYDPRDSAANSSSLILIG